MSTNDVGFWEGILEVATGRGQLRLILQPLVATVVGLRLGITDVKLGKDPFLLRLAFKTKNRRALLKEAAQKLVLPFALAILIDGVLQYLTLGYVRPFAALFMGIVLIWIPYALARSIGNRLYRRLRYPSYAR
jgi:hypothetical protein